MQLLELQSYREKQNVLSSIQSGKERAARLTKIYLNSVEFFSMLIGFKVVAGSIKKEYQEVSHHNFLQLAAEAMQPVKFRSKFGSNDEDAAFIEFDLNRHRYIYITENLFEERGLEGTKRFKTANELIEHLVNS